MSHTRHEVMAVTSFIEGLCVKVHRRLAELGLPLTAIYSSEVNDYHTFFVLPSGSKAGWSEAENHLKLLSEAREIIDSFKYEDGSSSVRFGVCYYGEFTG